MISQQIEERIFSIEKELAQVKQALAESQSKKLSWLDVVDSFENDPNFDEAVRLGQEWRKSAKV
jgi:hypothetical protein